MLRLLLKIPYINKLLYKFPHLLIYLVAFSGGVTGGTIIIFGGGLGPLLIPLDLEGDLNLWDDVYSDSAHVIALVNILENLNNWNDFYDDNLHLVDITKTLFDDNSVNWNDILNGERVDSAGWVDSLNGIEFGFGLEDGTNLIYGRIYNQNDDLNVSTEQVNVAVGYTLNPGENASTTWNDTINFGVGLDLIDDNSANWVDQFSTFGIIFLLGQIDDLNNWVDQIDFGNNIALEDSLVSFEDSIEVGVGLVEILNDDLNNWNDFTLLFIGLIINEDLNNWNEFLELGIGLSFNDDLNNFNDSIQTFSNNALSQLDLSDNLNILNDFIFFIYGIEFEVVDFQGFLSEEFLIGYGIEFNDSLNSWIDSIDIFYLLFSTVEDTLLFSDSLEIFLGRFVNVVDDLNSWNNSLIGTVNGNVTIDNWQDEDIEGSNGITFSKRNLSDDLNNFNDQLFLRFELVVVEDLNNWNDSYSVVFGSGFVDDLNNWLDVVETSLSIFVSDVESLNNWNDSLVGFVGGSTFDNWQDSDTEGSNGITFSKISLFEDLNNWLDTAFTGYTLVLEDFSFDLSDSILVDFFIGFTFSYELGINDDLNTLSDNLRGLIFNEFTWNDSFSQDNGSIILVLNDDLNNWYEFVQIFINQAELFLSFSENINSSLDEFQTIYGIEFEVVDFQGFFSDALNFESSVELEDSLIFNDNVVLGYGLVLNDDLNNWYEFVQIFINQAELFLSFSENFNQLLDELVIDYNFNIFDSIILDDFIEENIIYLINVIDNLNNWNDSFGNMANIVSVPLSDSIIFDDFFLSNFYYLIDTNDDNSFNINEFVEVNLNYEIIVEDEDGNNWYDEELFSVIGGLIANLDDDLIDDLNQWMDSFDNEFGTEVGLGDFNTNNLDGAIAINYNYEEDLVDDSNNQFEDIQFQQFPESVNIQIIISSNGTLNWGDLIESLYELVFEDSLEFNDFVEVDDSNKITDLEDFDTFFNDSVIIELSIETLKLNIESLEILEGVLIEN